MAKQVHFVDIETTEGVTVRVAALDNGGIRVTARRSTFNLSWFVRGSMRKNENTTVILTPDTRDD